MKTPFLVVLLALLYPFVVLANELLVHDPSACLLADEISCGTILNNQSNQSASNDLEEYDCSNQIGRVGYNGHERIYVINVSLKQHYDFRLYDVADPELNFDMFLMKEDCGKSSCIKSSTNDDNIAERISVQLNPGTYYLIVDTWAGEIGTFDLSVTCGPDPGPADCSGARSLSCNQTIESNTWGNESDFDTDLYNCYGGTGTYRGPDEIYVINKRRSSDHIRLHLYADDPNLNIFLVSRCDDVGFSCVASGRHFDGGRFIDEEDLGLPTGDYYVIVDGRNSATESAYSITYACNPFDFSDAIELICGHPREKQNFNGAPNQRTFYSCGDAYQSPYSGGEKIYYFDLPTVTDIKLTLDKTSTYGALGLFLFVEGSNHPVCLEGSIRKGLGDWVITKSLDRGRYYVVVDNSSEGIFTLNFTGCVCPTDDELLCGIPLNGSNAGGGDDVFYSAGACHSYPVRLDAQDRVYEFTAPESQQYLFRLNNLEKDLGLFIFDDCNDPESCVAFSNKMGDDEVLIFLEEGRTVYVAVDAIARLITSNFTLTAICDIDEDLDDDGVIDIQDNCVNIPNGNQADNDNDGVGDVCDDDDDNDGTPDIDDCAPFDDTIDYSIGDLCDDGNDDTINDVINNECVCIGQPRPDQDADGIPDVDDNCPETFNPDQLDNEGDGTGDVCDNDDDNDGVVDAVDCDPFDHAIDYKIGDACDDGDENTRNDRIDQNCLCSGDPDLQIFVSTETGRLGDTVCVDISVTEFTDVSSASLSFTIEEGLAKIISLTNVGLSGGTFTGSTSCGPMTGSLTSTGSLSGSNTGFFIWSANPGESLTLGPISTLVQVCAVITSDAKNKIPVSITDDCRDTEFFDVDAMEIPFSSNVGQICIDRTMPNMNVSGKVMNIASNGMENVSIDISGDQMQANTYTNVEGDFEFDVEHGIDFNLTPNSTDDLVDGITVKDVLIFRQHFSYIKTFDSPYQYIAADIDGNGKLSIRDEHLMKMMIMGLNDANYPLWKFVKADYEFPNTPAFAVSGEIFNYPDYAHVSELNSDMIQDFIGIRTGELELTGLVAENRTTRPSIISTTEQYFSEGELISVPLILQRTSDIAGLSLSLKIDTKVLSFENIVSELPGDISDMLVPRLLSNGQVVIQWIGDKHVDLDQLSKLFTITFKTNKSGQLSQYLELSHDYRKSEIINSKLENSELKLNFDKIENAGLLAYPSPATDEVNIEFISNKGQREALLNIYDYSGRKLYARTISVLKGANTFVINKQVIGLQDGVVLIEINTGDDIYKTSVLFVR